MGDEQFFFDFDTPSEALGGLSPFEVSRQAFSCHQSQIPSVFSRWIFGKNNEIKTASEIEEHSPLKFGLYHSIVGRDTGTGDIFEHLTPYSDVVTSPETDADTTPETTITTSPDTTLETVLDSETVAVDTTESAGGDTYVSDVTTEPSDAEAEYDASLRIFVVILICVFVAISIAASIKMKKELKIK